MINLDEVTKFDRTTAELEEFAIFSVLVAGKTAKTMVKRLDSLVYNRYLWHVSPFNCIKSYPTIKELAEEMRGRGIGCYNNKAKSIYQLIRSDLDLKTCTVDDLEKIYGIAEKTSRFFILHTRPNQQIAALDRHILHYMQDMGVANVPSNTPKGRQYKRLEQEFISLCQQQNKTPAQLDLEVWYKYSKYK